MEIGEFGVGRPDFGGRWPGGEALGQKKSSGARLKDVLRALRKLRGRGPDTDSQAA